MKKAMSAIAAVGRAAAGWAPDALMVIGVLSIAFGVRQIYGPAGWIVLGVFSLVAGVLAAKGGK